MPGLVTATAVTFRVAVALALVSLLFGSVMVMVGAEV
jgi:hypothetical protein